MMTAAFICLSVSAQTTTKQKVHLKGQLLNQGTTEIPLEYDGAASLVGNSRDIMLHTDARGNFDTTFVLKSPAYYRIRRNTLYLVPGDELTVKITENSNEATFKGKGAEINEYMKFRLFPKGGSFLESGDNIRADFQKTKALVDSLASVRRTQLNAVKTISSDFKKLEDARITADVLNSYLCYPYYASMLSKAKTREDMRKIISGFYASITPEVKAMYAKLCSDDLMDVAVVRDVMSYVVTPEDSVQRDWAKGLVLSQKIKDLYRAAEAVGQLREKVDEGIIKQVTEVADDLSDNDYAVELRAKIAQAGKLLKGSPAIDFTFVDPKGISHRLSEFKGKAIYLDFWATWCGPCKQESPFFEKLSRVFTDKDIVFIQVSTDTSKKAWLNFINVHNKELPQYNTVDDKIKTGWAIFYIPRFVLIDKDFKIVDAYAPRPSEPAAKSLIDSLLK